MQNWQGTKMHCTVHVSRKTKSGHSDNRYENPKQECIVLHLSYYRTSTADTALNLVSKRANGV